MKCVMHLSVIIALAVVASAEILNFERSICLSSVSCTGKNDDLLSILADFIDEFKAENETKFYLSTRNYRYEPIRLENGEPIDLSNFDKTKPTKVLIHGFLGSADSLMNKVIPLAYFENHDVNVIIGE